MSKIQRITKKSCFIVSLGAIFYFYEYYLRISPSVMKHEWVSSFHLNATKFGTLSAFYYYAYVPMQLIVGLLVDRFKMRDILTFAILCCVIGSVMIASTNFYYIAAIGRFLQGVGSAFAFVGALKLAATWLPASRFGLFSCSCASLGFMGAAIGEISLSEAVTSIGWRNSIYSFSAFGVFLMLVVWFALNNKNNKNNNSKNSNLHPHLHEHPPTPLPELLSQLTQIIKTPYIWIAGIISSLMFLPTSAFAELWGIPYLEKFHHYSSHTASTASAMIFIGWAIGAPIQGWLSDYFQNRVKVMLIGCIFGAILASIALFEVKLSYFSVCGVLMLFGIASSVQVLSFAMVKDIVPNKMIGTAIAFVNTLTMASGMIMQSGIGQILDLTWNGLMKNGNRIYSIENYQTAVLVIPACLLISSIIIFAIKNKTPRNIS